jgi:cholesterol oxidase
MTEERRRILRTEMFERVARRLGRSSHRVDINVFFGNDFEKPLPPGVQDRNRYGALQTSCVYCAECDIGCNYQAKNTLDLNYLFRAETVHGAEIRTEHLVDRIVPVDAGGKDDPAADGSQGYRVYYRDLTRDGAAQDALASRVIVSAGSLGSTELLLRCRDVLKTLPRIGWHLGRNFSGNGDFLGFVAGTEESAEPNYGPVITQAIDFNLFQGFAPDHAFILEDASYPSFLAWFVEGAKPGFLRLNSLWRTLWDVWARLKGQSAGGSIGYALSDLLGGDLSYNAAVLLAMGIDRSNGLMTLDRDGWLDLAWPTRDSRRLYDAILAAGTAFRRATKGDLYFAMPTWWWPLRKNVSVHPLGGCGLSDGPESGVTSAAPASFGQIHEYRNLFVADGAIVPAAIGANPTATIAALAEMVAEGITGVAPTADL